MDTNRLGRGELIAGVSGAVLLLVMFVFSWYSVDLGDAGDLFGIEADANAWEAFDLIDIILFVTAVVAIGLAIATAMSANVGLPVAGSALTAGLGILSLILVVYRVLNPPGDGLDRDIGLWLGLLATAGVAYGGWAGMQEEGTSFSEQADRLQSREESQPPPPPPPAQ